MRGLLLLLALLASGTSAAAPPVDRGGSWPLPTVSAQRVAERLLSVEQAARIAQRAVGGRVLAAEPGAEGDRRVVRVKLLTREGVVRVVIVDAVTGQVR